jgi:hypothetical protein
MAQVVASDLESVLAAVRVVAEERIAPAAAAGKALLGPQVP